MPDDLSAQSTFPQTSVQITQDGFLISIVLAPSLSINQGIQASTMHEIARQWVRTHPELQDELLKETVAAKRSELALIQDIKRSRND